MSGAGAEMTRKPAWWALYRNTYTRGLFTWLELPPNLWPWGHQVSDLEGQSPKSECFGKQVIFCLPYGTQRVISTPFYRSEQS